MSRSSKWKTCSSNRKACSSSWLTQKLSWHHRLRHAGRSGRKGCECHVRDRKRSTRDIGVRMAVGATPTAIRLHYLVQSLTDMMLGGLLGLGAWLTLVSAISAINLEGSTFYEHLGKPVLSCLGSLLRLWFLPWCLLVCFCMAACKPRRQKWAPLEALQSE